ncbi:MAG: hypothetical protein WCG26_08640, partial [Chloroflexales bacterium]
MATDYYGKQRATVTIGMELKLRGWTLLGFHEDKSDSMSDYYSPASWDGVAINAAYPGVVVGVNVYDATAKRVSGTDQTRTTREPGAPCARCGGSGTEPDALSYQDALANPAESHRARQDRAESIRMVIAIGSQGAQRNPVSRNDYHADGRPKCLACYGRGHAMRDVVTKLFTWPQFGGTPTGKAWHVEFNGARIASGTGFSKCDDFGEAGKRGARLVVDEIESAVKRTLRPAAAVGTTATSTTTPTAQAQGQLATSATGGAITVHAEHDEARGWTYIQLTPRVERAQYDAFAAAFGTKWHRMRRQPVLYRLVSATELAAFFGPVAGAKQPTTTTPEAPAAPVETPAAAIAPEQPQAAPVSSEAVRQITAALTSSRSAVIPPQAVPTAQVPMPLRYLLVRKGSGELYRDVDSGAVDIHLRDRYAVLVVIDTKAEYLLTQVRSGLAHLSTTVYASLEAADADAPNHLLPTVPAPVVEAQPIPAPVAEDVHPLIRIFQMRAEVARLRAEVADQVDAAARETARDAVLSLYAFEAETMRALCIPLAAEEQYRIRSWGDAAIAKRTRDLRARAFRAAGWEIKTSKTDGAFYLDAKNPWYSGAVVSCVSSIPGQSTLTSVTPENIRDQYQPTLLQPVAPVATTPVITADETPRHLAAPTV